MENKLFKKEQIAYNRGFRVTKEGICISPKGNKVGSINKYNYYTFGLRDIKYFTISIHRLQAYQKFGDKIYESNIIVRHLNGNSLDNSWDNIEIGTNSDNMLDIPKEIRIKKASNANKQYSDELHKQVIEAREQGMTYAEIMEKFGIKCKSQVSFMINKRIIN
ncbi:MAG: HNH endonuclease [Bacilli bacterium]|nr:HNH endonuclease [Bacilli bacterium]